MCLYPVVFVFWSTEKRRYLSCGRRGEQAARACQVECSPEGPSVGGKGDVHALPVQARVHHVPAVDIKGHRTISQQQSQWWAVPGPWGRKETDCNVAF